MNYALLLRSFLDGEGKLKQMPAKQKMRLYVYFWAASTLDKERVYSEPELNGALNRISTLGDPASLRRALVDFGFMERKPDGSAYWLKKEQPTPESFRMGL